MSTRLHLRVLLFLIIVLLVAITFQQQSKGIVKYQGPKASPKNSILYYNRHSGCLDNFAFVAKHFKFSFDTFDPSFIADFGTMSASKASFVYQSGLYEILCRYDVIIVSDTMPDFRPLIQNIDKCNSKIVFELTTRYNLFILDPDVYNTEIRALEKSKSVYWLSNNPYEIKYLHSQLGNSVRMRLGFSSVLPSQKQVLDISKSAILVRCDSPKVRNILDKFGGIIYLSSHYGGPLALANALVFIEFPYQVSTMKLYENIAHGVVVYLPSYTFLKQLVDNGTHEYEWMGQLNKFGPKWYEYVDYYSPELSPYLYYFDSFQDLFAIMKKASNDAKNNSSNLFDYKNVKVRGPKFYKEVMRKQILEGWYDIFKETNIAQSGLNIQEEMKRVDLQVRIN